MADRRTEVGRADAARLGNPYLDAYRQCADDMGSIRSELRRRFGFAVPDERALQLIADHSPNGVIEVGAGTGYWARLLHDRGIDVIACDIAPPPSSENGWFAGQEPWFPIQRGDERVVTGHPGRTLLLVWPTRNEDWAANATQLHLANGGRHLVYVGESPGGRSGDLRLHALLGLVGRCLACAYGVDSVPCTCGVALRWRLLARAPLPQWRDHDDELYIFGRPEKHADVPRWSRWIAHIGQASKASR